MECALICVCVECASAGVAERILDRLSDNQPMLLGLAGRAGSSPYHEAPREVFSLADFFSFQFEAAAYVSARDRRWVAKSFQEVIGLLGPEESWFTFLIKRMPAPDIGVREDEEVRSFVASKDVADRLCMPDGPSFSTVARLFSGEEPAPTLHAVQLPGALPMARRDTAPDSTAAPSAWVIPHRGPLEFLATCLEYLSRLGTPPGWVRIYFDEELTPAHHALMSRHPHFEYVAISPPGLGPYVARQHCSQELLAAHEDGLLVFQDSDDLPTVSRLAALRRQLLSSGADLVGSHQLQIDTLRKRFAVFRFPLDVNGALRHTSGHVLFHPTCMVRNRALVAAGGLSTVRRFGADTQLVLRAFFSMKIENVDEFLYIRRLHEDSLTTSPATALTSPERLRLLAEWKRDFARVKLGQLALADSSLAPSHTGVPHQILPLGRAE